MNSPDTNILARWLLEDDPDQTRMADDVLAQPVHITMTVLLELGWVLGSKKRLSRDTVADLLQTLLNLRTVNVGDRAGVDWAIERYRQGADWADMVHVVDSAGKAAAFVTFDESLARQAGPDSPIPVIVPGTGS